MAEQTFYYEYPDGSVTERVTTAAVPTHPDGATLLTTDSYAEKKAAIEATRAQEYADIQATETAQKKAAYDALIAANFDPAVAATLSGYTPSANPVVS
ncbi:hypothetical protein [Streptomyces prunicolor]|uniref:hypothetical protein n=1 Tax=Streptomyces prunicolor TaxID=67348 RepID=UPI0003721F27|nr:hypothetical protein [Streptomyces prunicolor]